MKIVIVGAGGIGGWLGARLAAGGQRVAFLVPGATLEALRAGGLTLLERTGGPPGKVASRIEAPVVDADPARLLDALGGTPDIVLVTTKVDAVAALADPLRALTGASTGVVSTQNGLTAPGLLADAVGAEHVLPGVARVYASVVRRGTIAVLGTSGSLAVGEWGGTDSVRVRALVDALNAAGIRGWVPDSIWAELWRKAAFVVPQGGLGALTDAPVGRLRTQLRDAYTAAVEEVVSVGQALGHRLATPKAPDPVAAVLAMADAQPPDATASMQRDLAAGAPSELDAQVGAVVRAGDGADVPTPVLDLVAAVLGPREAAARARAGTATTRP